MEQFIHSLIYGLIAGLAEILPISSYAHQQIYRYLFDFHPSEWIKLFTLTGSISALILCNNRRIRHLLREYRLSKPSRRRKSHPPDPQAVLTVRICRTALLPIMLSILLYPLAAKWINTFLLLSVMLFLNGLILFLPKLVPSGDKDCFTMTRLDNILIGLAGALGVIPGFSRVGCIASVAAARGTASRFSTDIALLITLIPLLFLFGLTLVGALISGIVPSGMIILYGCIAMVASFGGAYAGIKLITFIAHKSGISGFAYYSWGAAVLAFTLFMIV